MHGTPRSPEGHPGRKRCSWRDRSCSGTDRSGIARNSNYGPHHAIDDILWIRRHERRNQGQSCRVQRRISGDRIRRYAKARGRTASRRLSGYVQLVCNVPRQFGVAESSPGFEQGRIDLRIGLAHTQAAIRWRRASRRRRRTTSHIDGSRAIARRGRARPGPRERRGHRRGCRSRR